MCDEFCRLNLIVTITIALAQPPSVNTFYKTIGNKCRWWIAVRRRGKSSRLESRQEWFRQILPKLKRQVLANLAKSHSWRTDRGDFCHNGKNWMSRGERQARGVLANLAQMENGHNSRNFERHLMPIYYPQICKSMQKQGLQKNSKGSLKNWRHLRDVENKSLTTTKIGPARLPKRCG